MVYLPYEIAHKNEHPRSVISRGEQHSKEKNLFLVLLDLTLISMGQKKPKSTYGGRGKIRCFCFETETRNL